MAYRQAATILSTFSAVGTLDLRSRYGENRHRCQDHQTRRLAGQLSASCVNCEVISEHFRVGLSSFRSSVAPA